jgi:hypothetical protein
MTRNGCLKHLIAPAIALALVLPQVPMMVPVEAQSRGVIVGTVNGPQGPLSGTAVQLSTAAGLIVGTARTTPAGEFALRDLSAGTYTVLVLSSGGAIIGTRMVTLGAGAMAVNVDLTASPASLADRAIAVVQAPQDNQDDPAAAPPSGGISTRVILTTLAIAATTLGIAAILANKDEASGSR